MSSKLTPEHQTVIGRMTGAQKLRVANEMYWTARKVKAARVRQQHPDWTEAEVQERVKEIFLYAVT